MRHAIALALLWLSVGAAAGDDTKLLWHATRYGLPPARRFEKHRAREELAQRGAEGLRLAMAHAHLEIPLLPEVLMELVAKLDPKDAAPTLLEFTASEHSATRRWAAYLLGFLPTPEYAPQIRPLLRDEVARGAALRTLGKWRDRASLPDMIDALRDEREVRRVVAANALRDVGAAEAAPALVAALGDPMFTVREAAARALVRIGRPAEPALLVAAPRAAGHQLRGIIRVLGQIRSRRALGTLKRLSRHADPWVRADAMEAMQSIRGSAAKSVEAE